MMNISGIDDDNDDNDNEEYNLVIIERSKTISHRKIYIKLNVMKLLQMNNEETHCKISIPNTTRYTLAISFI